MIEKKKKKKKKKKSDFMLYLYLMMKSCKELNVMIVLATIYMIGERSPDEEEEEEQFLSLRRIVILGPNFSRMDQIITYFH